jgi:wobble nucleotide-excising tRNase
MINKIIKIQGIGLLHDAISPAKKFSKINLIYGENGRGKSTFVNIFSSLAKNDPSLLLARKTLDSTNGQEVELRINETNYRFSNQTWNKCFENIIIFDSTFVDTNVYSGFNVSSDQRKSLLEFTLGETGGELKNKVDDITHKISELSSVIGSITTTIAHIASPYPITTYLEIENKLEIDKEILESEKKFILVKKADEICKKPLLLEFPLLNFEFQRLFTLLETSLFDISVEAKARVIEHMNSHMVSVDEQWIKEGLNLIKNESCPFCGQDLDAASTLIELYQKFFDESYLKFQEELQSCLCEIENIFSEENLSDLVSIEAQNILTFDNIWGDLIELSYEIPSIKQTKTVITEVRETCIFLIKMKIANPTKKILDFSKYDEAKTKFANVQAQLIKNNQSIRVINQKVINKKDELKRANLGNIQKHLQQLNIIKERHLSPNKDICEQYTRQTKEKSDLERQKIQAKDALAEYSNTLLNDLEGEINRYLVNFGAGYQIVNVTTSHEAGYPRINYKLQLRNKKLELGTRADSTTKPVFSNSLSDGDKRTLAFAFFLAKINLEPNLVEKIIIVDDPMSSLDQSRQLATQTALKKLALSGKQLLVLSHDPRFLQDFIDNSYLNSNEMTTFELQRCNNNYSVLKECNFEELIQSGYKKNFKIVSEYVSSGQCTDKFSVVRAIRPLIETNLKYRLMSSLQNADNLGKMIGLIRDSQPGTLLSKVKPLLPQLNEINVYTTRLTHGTDGDASEQQINDAELRHFAELAIEFIHGFDK